MNTKIFRLMRNYLVESYCMFTKLYNSNEYIKTF